MPCCQAFPLQNTAFLKPFGSTAFLMPFVYPRHAETLWHSWIQPSGSIHCHFLGWSYVSTCPVTITSLNFKSGFESLVLSEQNSPKDVTAVWAKERFNSDTNDIESLTFYRGFKTEITLLSRKREFISWLFEPCKCSPQYGSLSPKTLNFETQIIKQGQNLSKLSTLGRTSLLMYIIT